MPCAGIGLGATATWRLGEGRGCGRASPARRLLWRTGDAGSMAKARGLADRTRGGLSRSRPHNGRNLPGRQSGKASARPDAGAQSAAVDDRAGAEWLSAARGGGAVRDGAAICARRCTARGTPNPGFPTKTLWSGGRDARGRFMARPRLASRGQAAELQDARAGLVASGPRLAAIGGTRLVKWAVPAMRRVVRIAKHDRDPVERRPGGCLVVSGARSCRWKPSRCNFAISRSYPMQGVRAPVLVGGKRGRADAGSRGAFRQIVQLPHASVRGPMRECGVAGGWVGRWPGWRRPRTTPHATGDGAAGRGGRRGGGLSLGGRRGRPASNDTPCNGTWSGWTWWPPGGGLSLGGRWGRPASDDTPCNGTWSGWTWWPPGWGLSLGGRWGRPTSNDTPCNGTWSGWTWWPPGGGLSLGGRWGRPASDETPCNGTWSGWTWWPPGWGLSLGGRWGRPASDDTPCNGTRRGHDGGSRP